jgi:hypothetical protein
MKMSRQFWQDVDLAISILMLRQSIRQVIFEGRTSRPQINKGISTPPDRDRVLYRYHEVMMARYHNHHGQMFV